MKARACGITTLLPEIGVDVVKGFPDTGNSSLGRERVLPRYVNGNFLLHFPIGGKFRYLYQKKGRLSGMNPRRFVKYYSLYGYQQCM